MPEAAWHPGTPSKEEEEEKGSSPPHWERWGGDQISLFSPQTGSGASDRWGEWAHHPPLLSGVMHWGSLSAGSRDSPPHLCYAATQLPREQVLALVQVASAHALRQLGIGNLESELRQSRNFLRKFCKALLFGRHCCLVLQGTAHKPSKDSLEIFPHLAKRLWVTHKPRIYCTIFNFIFQTSSVANSEEEDETTPGSPGEGW